MFNLFKEYTILLLGETGTGKSALGNFILGEDLFKESDDFCSCTKNTICKYSKKYQQIAVIDTPGLQDSKGMDKIHYDQMLQVIKDMKDLYLIILVFNYNQPRITPSNKYMINFLCDVFRKDFASHLGIVFTHYRDNKYDNDPKKTKFINKVKNFICEETNEYSVNIPAFFIENKLKDNMSQRELKNMIYLATIKEPINTILEKDFDCKEEFSETKVFKEGVSIDDKRKKINNVKYHRKIRKDYNGNITKTEWVKDDTYNEYIDLPYNEEAAEEEEVEEEEKEEEKKIDNHRQTFMDEIPEFDKNMVVLKGLANIKNRFCQAKTLNDKMKVIGYSPIYMAESAENYLTKKKFI